MRDEAIVEDVVRLVRTSEGRLPARIRALLALEYAGFDTVEAEAAMWLEWEALNALHRQEWEAIAMGDL